MSSLPDLTLCILTYKRPWYAIPTLQTLIHKVQYDGHKKFHIADGGSPQEHIDVYKQVLGDADYTISVTDNLSDMVNACAEVGGDVWLTTVDDFMFNRKIDLTPDVKFLLANEDVGVVRMGRLAFWEHGPDETIQANLRMLGGLHWWVMNKEVSNHPYIHSINTMLYHRRFWDTYGPIAPCPPDLPGDAELKAASRYNDNPSTLTTAVPMRFGEDCGDWNEPVTHFGMWRTDEYTARGGGRRI